MFRKKWIGYLFLVTWFSSLASADTIFFGSSGSLSASIRFELAGGDLEATLSNLSTYDVTQPSQILTAVFFDVAGNPSLSRISAVVAPDSTVWFGGTDPGGVVGGEWAYASSLSGAPRGAQQGISSAGFDLFGPGDRFPGTNLQGPDSPDGIQYGITSLGDNPLTGNAPVTGSQALIHNSVAFTLGGLPSEFKLEDVSNVWFQYGTSLTEPGFPDNPNPEPASILLVVPGLIWAIWRYRARPRS